MLLFALEDIILPAYTDPPLDSLTELLLAVIDCYNLGWYMYDFVGVGTPGIYELGCQLGVAAGANIIRDQFLSLSGSAQIAGEATIDKNDGGTQIDALVGGTWEGILSVGSDSSTLSKPHHRFTGLRQ